MRLELGAGKDPAQQQGSHDSDANTNHPGWKEGAQCVDLRGAVAAGQEHQSQEEK